MFTYDIMRLFILMCKMQFAAVAGWGGASLASLYGLISYPGAYLNRLLVQRLIWQVVRSYRKGLQRSFRSCNVKKESKKTLEDIKSKILHTATSTLNIFLMFTEILFAWETLSLLLLKYDFWVSLQHWMKC